MSALCVSVVFIWFRWLKGFVCNITNKLKKMILVILSSSKRYQFNWIRFRWLGIGITAFILDKRVGWRWVTARRPFLLVFTKWVRVFHNAILKCSKTVFAGISLASRLFILVFHGIDEQLGESRIFLELWLYFRSFSVEVKVIVFVMNAQLKENVCKISKCKY